MIYNCPEQKKLVETETYIKLFGGECEIIYDPKQNTFHIHIKNDDIGYCCFHIPQMAIKRNPPHEILDFLCKEYLSMMFMHQH